MCDYMVLFYKSPCAMPTMRMSEIFELSSLFLTVHKSGLIQVQYYGDIRDICMSWVVLLDHILNTIQVNLFNMSTALSIMLWSTSMKSWLEVG